MPHDQPLGIGKFTDDPISGFEQAESPRAIMDLHHQAVLLAEALPTSMWCSMAHQYQDRGNRPTNDVIKDDS